MADAEVDIFDREAVFIETVLEQLRKRLHRELKVTMEHVTTSNGIDYIKSAASNLAGSITTHHLVINRNAISSAASSRIIIACPSPSAKANRLALLCGDLGDSRFFPWHG